jgi:WD40 repeat protein
MIRRIVISGAAAGALFAVSICAVGWSTVVAQVPGARPAQRREVGSEPIVIPNGRLRLIDVEDVPSQRDGVLMVIGTETSDGQQVPTHDVVQVQIGEVTKQFRRLKEGDTIQADQLLAMVDDTLARADVDIKLAKLSSAIAEKNSAEKTKEEADERLKTQRKLYSTTKTGIRATSLEDLRGAELTYIRYVEEANSKAQAIEVAKQELNQARKTLSMYEIRPKVSGTVKMINKHRGEAVKSLEPVLQIQNYDRLRVDALLPEQYANRLDKGMEITIEPTLRESPKQTLVGHRGAVTAVAVSKDSQKPLIVSGSDDRTVRVWELASGEGRLPQSRVLKHPAPVSAVACTPPTASVNLCLSGDEQGNGLLWDLNDRSSEKPLRELKGQHKKAITCVAFSADGQMCATGGADQEIKIWDTATGDRRYSISAAHHNMITALSFAPDSGLISVGRDQAVHFWKLGTNRAELLGNETIQRRREVLVDNLGVSPDGKHMMDEQFGEMRIVSLPRAVTEAFLRSTVIGKKFINFALFAPPDGQLALTTPETGGMLQLWRISYNQPRSYELRQFVSPVRAVAKSAAFAPDGSFVVAAINDRVFVWQMPGKEEVKPILATITNIEKPIEAVENQVKVTAELENPGQRLRPGDVVTMVAYPQK